MSEPDEKEVPMTTDGFTTCLWFDGQAEEAAKPLHVDLRELDARKGERIRRRVRMNGQKFFGLNGGPQHTFTGAISFQIFCDDQDEVDYYWSRLTDGGEESICGGSRTARACPGRSFRSGSCK
jgi:predicted 3-demethylubiquinone-9 3-methyltransferase (glyoxalase superfamily)